MHKFFDLLMEFVTRFIQIVPESWRQNKYFWIFISVVFCLFTVLFIYLFGGV